MAGMAPVRQGCYPTTYRFDEDFAWAAPGPTRDRQEAVRYEHESLQEDANRWIYASSRFEADKTNDVLETLHASALEDLLSQREVLIEDLAVIIRAGGQPPRPRHDLDTEIHEVLHLPRILHAAYAAAGVQAPLPPPQAPPQAPQPPRPPGGLPPGLHLQGNLLGGLPRGLHPPGNQGRGSLPPDLRPPGNQGRGGLPQGFHPPGNQGRGGLPPDLHLPGNQGRGGLPRGLHPPGNQGQGGLPRGLHLPGNQGRGGLPPDLRPPDLHPQGGLPPGLHPQGGQPLNPRGVQAPVPHAPPPQPPRLRKRQWEDESFPIQHRKKGNR